MSGNPMKSYGKSLRRLSSLALVMAMLCAGGAAQDTAKKPQTAAERVAGYFHDVNRKVLEMAKDFPEDKYDYKLKPEMRSFGEVIIHVAGGNVYAAKRATGAKVKWEELDPKQYKTKAEIVAEYQKTMDQAEAAMKAHPQGPNGNLEQWMGVMQHSSEHYGLLVAYYRANGLVPPESRKK